ncbi:MAG: DJ-1/PfpI family protein [Alphaproteobacteria bacterium]|nr:DJ-1/PfpI family protein [Alphaproteobacteria bacterium]
MADEIQVQSVAHVVFEGFTTLDMYGPVQAFASSRVTDGDGGWHRFFNQFTIGDSPAAVKSGEGPSTIADYSFEDAPDFDILLIPGGFGTRAAVSNDALLAKIAAMSAKADVTATVCTGSAVLARTGLLDGRPATSNKVAWDWVLEQGPKVDWKRQARWVDDGDIVTSSGVSAGIDMALDLIARLRGEEIAVNSARYMEYIWNRDPANDPFA